MISNANREVIMGKEGEKIKNNNGERLIQFCMETNLIIANAKFRHNTQEKNTLEKKSP